ncbi:MAG: glycosyltransferase family 61 protein [SAR324 cluster bacterium]|nr:glycosyltransferase family 61 protein [SAR324 cluster bacterium]
MSLILENALLSASDGLVQARKKIWFHFQKYPWDLGCPENNPGPGVHRRRIEARILRGLPEPKNTRKLSGTYHLGISPHIYSYYHLFADLLPHLIVSPQYPVLVPEFLPKSFIKLLNEVGFQTLILPPENFQVEQLIVPEITTPDWNLKKINTIQSFFEKIFPLKSPPDIPSSKSAKRIYISRKLAVKRHLANEVEFLPLLKKNDFQKEYLERMRIQQQVELFREASHIVAAHGAGLTNILFAPTKVKILEIRPLLSSGQFCFENLFSQKWNESELLVPPRKGKFILPLDSLSEVLERWGLDNHTN